MIVAVNRGYRSDYIPCIAWGRNARMVKDFEVGTKIDIKGRVQSREYVKRFDDGTQETRTAYEISITTVLDDEGRFEVSLDDCYPSTI